MGKASKVGNPMRTSDDAPLFPKENSADSNLCIIFVWPTEEEGGSF